MATSLVNGEFHRIICEMLAWAAWCWRDVEILEVETGALVVLQACRWTVKAWSDVSENLLWLIGRTQDWSRRRVAKYIIVSHSDGAWLTLYQAQTGNQQCSWDVIHCFTLQLIPSPHALSGLRLYSRQINRPPEVSAFRPTWPNVGTFLACEYSTKHQLFGIIAALNWYTTVSRNLGFEFWTV